MSLLSLFDPSVYDTVLVSPCLIPFGIKANFFPHWSSESYGYPDSAEVYTDYMILHP